MLLICSLFGCLHKCEQTVTEVAERKSTKCKQSENKRVQLQTLGYIGGKLCAPNSKLASIVWYEYELMDTLL